VSTTISENANSLQFELGNFLEDKAPLLHGIIEKCNLNVYKMYTPNL